MLKVLKFGGSSLADAQQFAKVKSIVEADESRRVVIVSAPGKRFSGDHKITDLLYLCAAHIKYGVSCEEIFDMIRTRYLEIAHDCGLKLDLNPDFDALWAKMQEGIEKDELASRGERIDMATVEAEMFRLDHRLYGELNGVSFLSAMLQAVRNDSHIHEYVRLVQREWMLRGCVASLNKRGLEAQQPDVDVMKLLAGVTDDMDGLREHASGGVDVRMAAEVAREVLARSFRNQEAREKGEHIQVRTGFDELDDLTGGLYRGELAVLSGRLSMGKTAVALHMALQAARAGRNTLYFSIEMSEEEVTERILSMLSGVEAGKIRFKGTNREERALLEKAAVELAGLPLRIVYCGSLAIDEIRAVLMTRKARRELDIFFIDYLNLIHIPYTRGSRNETTDLALGDVVRKVKLMAVELDVPAVLLAQMNRDSDRRLAPYLPILSDLRNSGAIEQVADQVIFVYRAEKYGILYDKDTKEDLRGVGYLLVAKNRNGATGRARFRYNVSMTRFLSYENRLL